MTAPSADKLVPYVVTKEYLAPTAPPEGIAIPIGHDLFAHLSLDFDGVTKGVEAQDLKVMNLTPKAAHAKALENLDRISQEIDLVMLTSDKGLPFITLAGHWLAASCVRLPSIFGVASRELESETLIASIPNREIMLLFPPGTPAQMSDMLGTIRKNERSAPKKLTWELFNLTSKGLSPRIGL